MTELVRQQWSGLGSHPDAWNAVLRQAATMAAVAVDYEVEVAAADAAEL